LSSRPRNLQQIPEVCCCVGVAAAHNNEKVEHLNDSPEVPSNPAAEEIKSLQRCIHDLVSVLGLSAIWTGGEPAQIVNTLIDALLTMLRADLVFARVRNSAEGGLIERLRVAHCEEPPLAAEPVARLLDQWTRDDPQNWPSVARTSFADAEISVVPLRVGVYGDSGLIVVGSRRADFPRRTERLLLSVAVNQAAIGLQEARLLSEQRRAASDLDQRVAQRTRELAAAVEELQLRVSMLQKLPVAAWSLRLDGTPDIVNQSWYNYAGLTPEYVRSHPDAWTLMLHPEDRHRATQSYWAGIHSGRGFTMEARFRRASDGAYRWHLNRAVPVRDAAGKIQGFVGTSTDIEELKQAQDELRNMQAELAHMTRVMTVGELTASIAHEVNQPLSGIVTNASTCLRMLAGTPPNVDGASETVRRTLRDAKRASEVVTRLRGLFAGKEIVAESVDLNEAAREVIALCSAALRRNRVVLRTELAEDLPPVMGDRVQLQQVILNLINNASDAMTGIDDRPRDLLVRTALDEADLVRVTVTDSGSGFLPQDAQRLFTAFYTTKRSGMGIGLSVSRSIIESHDGRLWAECNPGSGATFSFSIPLRRTSPQAAPVPGERRARNRRQHEENQLPPHLRLGDDVTPVVRPDLA
jgi:PAS domain S-box-containing protein